jgi:hypothetical protein
MLQSPGLFVDQQERLRIGLRKQNRAPFSWVQM